MLDSTWNLRVVPAVSYDRGLPIKEPVWIFIVGLVISVLASGAMLQAMMYRRRDRLRTQEHLGALAALNQVSAAVTAAPDGVETGLLAQIAEEAKRLLHMPMGGVLLLEQGEPATIRIVPAPSDVKPVRERLTFAETSGVSHCLQTGQVLIVPDIRRDRGPLSAEQIEPYDICSVVMVPLVVNGRPLGVIGLCDYVPRHFTDLEIRMAELFGAQAAVVLAQSRLYEQLRHQVDTNQTLLRELNHRVKNNLAGIHGLLVMDQPHLSDEARDWLDRVVARVDTMARAHELFSGGMDSVGLEDVVNTTLASIRAIKPSGVKMEVDVAALGQAALATDRAVTLAIVLNELCYNSIVHGVGRDGTLTVRGRTTANPGMAAIDVIDTGGNQNGNANGGSGSNRGPAPGASSGIGLSLVRQLVGRELQGTLSIDTAADGGGTVATVHFPLARMTPDAGECE
jgi:two-component sensor histidine kinase